MRPAQIDNEKLIDLYVNQKLTVRVCSIQLNINQTSLLRRLRKLGITIRPPVRRLITDIDDQQVVDLYWNKKLSISQTAKLLGRSEGLVRKRLKLSGRGTRSISDGSKIRKGTANITDEQLIYLHDIRDWTCAKISRYFNKSEDFVRQRFRVIGKSRRKNVGRYNGAYKDGRTPLRTRIRDCAKSLSWKQICMERDNYTCKHTGKYGGKLEVHHIKSFSQILEEFLSLNSDLNPENDCDQLFELSQHYDPFWDTNNGITLSEEAHHTLNTP